MRACPLPTPMSALKSRSIANLKRAGTEASVDVYPHWFHAYDMLLPFAKKSKEAVRHFEEHYLYATEHYFAPQRIPPSLD